MAVGCGSGVRRGVGIGIGVRVGVGGWVGIGVELIGVDYHDAGGADVAGDGGRGDGEAVARHAVGVCAGGAVAVNVRHRHLAATFHHDNSAAVFAGDDALIAIALECVAARAHDVMEAVDGGHFGGGEVGGAFAHLDVAEAGGVGAGEIEHGDALPSGVGGVSAVNYVLGTRLRPLVVAVSVVAFSPVDELRGRKVLIVNPLAGSVVGHAAVVLGGIVGVAVVGHRHVFGILGDDRGVGTGLVEDFTVVVHTFD